jgi:hypothetical protein
MSPCTDDLGISGEEAIEDSTVDSDELDKEDVYKQLVEVRNHQKEDIQEMGYLIE